MEKLGKYLEKKPNILFAYMYGSFMTAERFRDIDVAVYLRQAPSAPLQAELEFETELADLING